MKLSELHAGERGVVVKVTGHGGFRRRIVEMGFIRGTVVRVVLGAPLADPVEYELMGYKISLRRAEAEMVEVIGEADAVRMEEEEPAALSGIRLSETDFCGRLSEDRMERLARTEGRTINVALVGNPNCGKTTLFNLASGSREHVGNYSGVTVDAKEAGYTLRVDGFDYHFRIVDLPGTYSLSAYSPEEVCVRRHLIDRMPDVVVNVIDATNLERNLYLTTQLIDMHLCMVGCLNMYDALERSGDSLDYRQLGALLGVPFVPTVSRTGQGVEELFRMVVAVYESNDEALARHIHVNHGALLEEEIDKLKLIFRKNTELRYKYSTRYLALKFLEGDGQTERLVESLPQHDELIAIRFASRRRIQEEFGEPAETAIVSAKYGFIQGALRETYRPNPARHEQHTPTERIDRIVTHRYLGFPLFFVLLYLMFWGTFTLGDYPMMWIEWLVDRFGDGVAAAMPEGPLRDLLTEGIIGGVGSVIVFLPNILLLYFFISLLEDSGYMARAAFIMDKLMHKMGLHGKSFIPMVMGFGCNVPAVMATRIIENRKSRLVTMLVTPLMSCSARLPIYIIIIGAFFPDRAAAVMLGLYAFGILMAAFMARLFSRFIVQDADLPFVMELPPYRMPNRRSIMRHTWEKGRQYLRKMGGIILASSIVVWALGYFPRTVGDEIRTESRPVSFLEHIGKTVQPVFSPMDYDWKMSVGILTGIGAKELVVSTLGVMYAGEEIDDADIAAHDSHLQASIRNNMTPASALSYMVFVLLYFPCLATLVAIRHESGRWRWALFTAVYTTALAWCCAWIAYQLFSCVF